MRRIVALSVIPLLAGLALAGCGSSATGVAERLRYR